MSPHPWASPPGPVNSSTLMNLLQLRAVDTQTDNEGSRLQSCNQRESLQLIGPDPSEEIGHA
jgi:hypothetical protein